MPVPALNPYLAPDVICPNCGNRVSAETVKMGKGRVAEVQYICVNPEKNCTWKLDVSLQHIMGQIDSLRPEEVEKRRAQLEAMKEMSEKRETALRELVAMTPRLKELVALLLQQDKNETPAVEDKTKQLKESPGVQEIPAQGTAAVGTEQPQEQGA